MGPTTYVFMERGASNEYQQHIRVNTVKKFYLLCELLDGGGCIVVKLAGADLVGCNGM